MKKRAKKELKEFSTILLILSILIISSQIASAVKNTGHITLLAVYHEGDKFSGSPANLQLEIKKGTGRVFLETIPLTKVDTQISTRFAKQIACEFSETDCSKYDFFYTIKSPAGIVGGPSAGSAITALTAAMLMDLKTDPAVSVTGTINSGELIGPVGSLKEKIDAAKEAGIKEVMIPAVQQQIPEDNITTLVEYGKKKGIKVVPVNTLAEVMTEMTGKNFTEPEKEITVPELYIKTMREVSDKLCKHAEELINKSSVFDLGEKKELLLDNIKRIQEAKNLTRKAEEAKKEKKYYSRASYCFGASVLARKTLIKEQNLDKEGYKKRTEELETEIEDLDKQLDEQKKETITDLQTYMIVKERILEAKNTLKKEKNDSENIGYATERLYSAESWSQFFGKGGERYKLDDKSLKTTCENTLQEVEERFQYINLFFPGILKELRANVDAAQNYYDGGEYALCIFMASTTKANANIIVTLLGVNDESIDAVLEQKLKAAKRAITKQIGRGTFPILANSYYEYAESLKKEDPISALLYSEYALELSDISIYFEKQESKTRIKWELWKIAPITLFIWGLILGYLYAWTKHRTKKTKTEKEKDKKKEGKTKKYKGTKKEKKKRPRTRLRLR